MSRTKTDRRSWIALLVGAAAGGPLVAGASASAGFVISSTIIKIADTNTSVPSGGGSIFTVFGRPSISGLNVAFQAKGAGAGGATDGVYHNIGALTRVADTNTLVPGGGGATYSLFSSSCDISGSKVVFVSDFPRGVYTADGGIVSLIANTATPNPAGAGALSQFKKPSIDILGVSFEATVILSPTFPIGVYTTIGGGLSRVFDTTMQIPGTATTANFAIDPAVSGTNTLFFLQNGTGSVYCICAQINGAIVTIVGPGDFPQGVSATRLAAISGENVAWPETQIGLAGAIRVSARISGVIGPVVSSGQVAPDSGVTMLRFGDVSIDGDTVSFTANNSGGGVFGVFVRIAGQIHTVLLSTSPLDGKTIQNVQMSPFALDSDNIAFKVAFTDGSQGIFMATLTVNNAPDIDGDGMVGASDLASLIGSWGPCPPAPATCPADLNGDGVVGASDLAILIGSWG